MTLKTINELAADLRVSRSFIYRAVAAGKLPCVRVGARLRFNPDQVTAVLLQADGDRVSAGPAGPAGPEDEPR